MNESVKTDVNVVRIFSAKTSQSDANIEDVESADTSTRVVPIRVNKKTDLIGLKTISVAFSDSNAADERLRGGTVDAGVSLERLYPQFFDEDTAVGRLRVLVLRALDDARRSVEAFECSDLQMVGSCLAIVASIMRDAYEETSFNEDFGAIVSFIRRATLVASPTEVTLSSLNALVGALAGLSDNPAVGFAEAVDITDKLTEEGWRGEHSAVVAMVDLLLAPLDIDSEGSSGLNQPELFEGHSA